MKCLSLEDRELIRRARMNGREARENEERERIEKGSHCFLKSSGNDKGIKIWFLQAYRMHF